VEELNQTNKNCDTRRSTVQHTKERIGKFLKKMGREVIYEKYIRKTYCL
jgi:hypothetical protein